MKKRILNILSVILAMFMFFSPVIVHAEGLEFTDRDKFINTCDFLASYSYYYALEHNYLDSANNCYIAVNMSDASVRLYPRVYYYSNTAIYSSSRNEYYYEINGLLDNNVSVQQQQASSSFVLYGHKFNKENNDLDNYNTRHYSNVDYPIAEIEANMPEPLNYTEAKTKYFGGEIIGDEPIIDNPDSPSGGDVNITIVNTKKIERILSLILDLIIFVVLWSMFLYPLAHKMTNGKGVM